MIRRHRVGSARGQFVWSQGEPVFSEAWFKVFLDGFEESGAEVFRPVVRYNGGACVFSACAPNELV
jgi:hypothetical protein